MHPHTVSSFFRECFVDCCARVFENRVAGHEKRVSREQHLLLLSRRNSDIFVLRISQFHPEAEEGNFVPHRPEPAFVPVNELSPLENVTAIKKLGQKIHKPRAREKQRVVATGHSIAGSILLPAVEKFNHISRVVFRPSLNLRCLRVGGVKGSAWPRLRAGLGRGRTRL